MPDVVSSDMTETCSQPGRVQLSGLLILTLEEKRRTELLLFSGKEKESSGVLIFSAPGAESLGARAQLCSGSLGRVTWHSL